MGVKILVAFALLLSPLFEAQRGDAAVTQLCFEKIYDTSGLYLQEHPARNRAVLALQTGQMYLITLPKVGSKAPSKLVSTYLDLSPRVANHEETGLLSFAFHPNFAANGRFFVSYICDSTKTPDCKAPCGCNKRVGCIVGQRNAKCNLVTIIAEYSAGRRPMLAKNLRAKEVRRILSFARPYLNHMGGQIFFGKDRMLYYTSGDGGSSGDPWKLAQNGKSNFGKILRINVNKRTNTTNYVIPKDNPFVGSGYNPATWALGLRNPWRCHQSPSTGVIACGDVGQAKVEEINIIKPGHNYQWNGLEGPLKYPGGYQGKFLGISARPLFSYTHDSLGGLGCVIGGVFHTSAINPCLKDKYLYADYSGVMWLATIAARSSTRRVSFRCSPDSPLACPTSTGDGSDTEWGAVLSWAADLSGNSYLLTELGVFRLANQSSCGIKC